MSLEKWLETRKRIKRKKKSYEIRLGLSGFSVDVLKAALKAYSEHAIKAEKAVADDMLMLIEYQENKQNQQN